jgi:hypothetical protein
MQYGAPVGCGPNHVEICCTVHLSLRQSPDSAATSLQPNTYKAQSVAGDALRNCSKNASGTLQPLSDKGCSDVANRNGESGGNEKSVAGARRVNGRTTSGESSATAGIESLGRFRPGPTVPSFFRTREIKSLSRADGRCRESVSLVQRSRP